MAHLFIILDEPRRAREEAREGRRWRAKQIRSHRNAIRKEREQRDRLLPGQEFRLPFIEKAISFHQREITELREEAPVSERRRAALEWELFLEEYNEKQRRRREKLAKPPGLVGRMFRQHRLVGTPKPKARKPKRKGLIR